MENKKIQSEVVELNHNKFIIAINVIGLNSSVRYQMGFKPLFCSFFVPCPCFCFPRREHVIYLWKQPCSQ